MRVENGGEVLLRGFTTTIANASIVVTGADSTWVQGGDLNLSQGGLTVLLIENGGSMTQANAVLGVSSGATAIIVVTGDDSLSWDSFMGLMRSDIGMPPSPIGRIFRERQQAGITR